MNLLRHEYRKKPTASINISNLQLTDVSDYGTAQISDANLVASNIADTSTVLGIAGSYATNIPIEISTEAELEAVLSSSNRGKLYKFTGTSSTYTTNALYLVESFGADLCFTANTAGSTLNINYSGDPYHITIKYSTTDRRTWQVYTSNTTLTFTNAGDKIYFRGNNPNGISQGGMRFNMTGSIAASGSLMSLIDDGREDTFTMPSESNFEDLFYNCTALTSAPDLPATDLSKASNYCYGRMFSGCTGLVTGPSSLPATAVAYGAYYNMFRDCTSLTTPPNLIGSVNADNVGYGMFQGCTALKTAPTTIGDTSVGSYGCFNMFYGCTSLVTAPTSLPATTVGNYGYGYMFYNCSSLVTCPSLPATTLASGCYYNMFYNCSALTHIPALPATALVNNCYNWMFYNCTSLYISDTSGTGYDKELLLPSSGTFTNTTTHYNMFYKCATGAGRASSDLYATTGESYKYYTQNTPV